MKKLFASLLTLGLLLGCGLFSTPAPNPARTLTPTLTQAPPPATTLTPPPNLTDLFPFRAGLVTTDQPVFAEMNGASVYRIELVIDEELVHVDGTEVVRYTNQEDAPLTEVDFRLFPNILGGKMTVSELTVNGGPVTPKYELEDSQMIVPLAEPLAVGKSVTIAMAFAVTVPTDVELNYGVFASYEGVLTLAHSYPMIAVYDNTGWNAEIPPQWGDVTYADMSFFLVKVTAPEDVTVVASGVESAPETVGRQVVQNVREGPARDFFLAASRDFQVQSKTVGQVTINSYAPKALQGGSEAALEVAVRALETYSDAYAPYPYTELDVVATPTLALGVEYPGVIAIAERVYSDTTYGEQTSIVRESTVAHEVGHQWFYNLVGNDQLDEPWLDESLAQFATWQYYKSNFGFDAANGFKASFVSRWDNVNSQPIPIDQPVAAFTGAQYSAIVYGRGPLFFIALRDKMGATAFDEFLRDYVATYSWGIATTAGLKSLAEKHCNCDLTSLFEEWIY
jgi:hypothetical protein